MSKKLRNTPLGRIDSAMEPDTEWNFAEIKLYKETCGTHPQKLSLPCLFFGFFCWLFFFKKKKNTFLVVVTYKF